MMLRVSLVLLSSLTITITSVRPPGLGRPYGNDVIGHDENNNDDQLVMSSNYQSDYNNDEEYYDEYDDYDDEENDYYEDSDAKSEYDTDDYYDYEYLDEKQNGDNNEGEEYEYYREEHDGVLKLKKDDEEYYDYYEEEDSYDNDKLTKNESEDESSYDDYYEDYDGYTDNEDTHTELEEKSVDIKPSENDGYTDDKDTHQEETEENSIENHSKNFPTDDEDIQESSGSEEIQEYYESTKSTTASIPSTTTTTLSTTSTKTTITVITSTLSTTSATEEEYYFEGESSGDQHYDEIDEYSGHYDERDEFIGTATENIVNTPTEHIIDDFPHSTDWSDDEDEFIEGSGSSTEHKSSTPKYLLETTDDEDFIDGSADDINDIEHEVTQEEHETEQIKLESETIKDDLSESETKQRSDFFELHGLDLLSLDMSCMQNFVSGPDIENGHLAQYQYDGDGTRQYAEAVYECDDGYHLRNSRISSMFCQDGAWRGEMPRCDLTRSPEVTDSTRHWCDESDMGKCSQLCYTEAGMEDKLCDCHPGYVLAEDGHSCLDVNECDLNNGGCDQLCHNRPGTFMCECYPGYSGSISCLDINECLLNNGHGPCQDTCTNTDGGYQCTCENLPGTSLGQDNHTCQAGGGCLTDNGGCSHECIDSYNQVFCMCPDGFLLGSDWKTCEDVDECEDDNMGCDHMCVNTPGSYRCDCREGYHLDNDVCQDVDECALDDKYGCSHGCVNHQGSAECTCPSGMELSLSDSKTCLDVDECLKDNGKCQQVCINKVGGVECGCDPGYRLAEDDKSCLDIDECAVEDICGAGRGDCVNTGGGYTCTCHPGYSLSYNGDTCQDVDECQENPCGAGECINSDGGYECFCQSGFAFDGESCFDLDECLIGNPCIHGECSNKEGGYECHCHDGFYQEEGVCVDINECTSLTVNPCGAGQCLNTEGGYQCQCPPGYQHTDGGCHDVDECLGDPCGDHGDCVNIPGSHMCQCHPGFVFNVSSGAGCVDIDECLDNPCKGGECINKLGHFECKCSKGFSLDAKTNTCHDQDECLLDNGGCQHSCANTPGHRTCSCSPGYKCVDDDCTRCQDIDECEAADNGGCSQLCVNTDGGRQCECRPGYQLAPDNVTCGDLNECTRDNGGCSHMCTNTPGGRTCQCPEGWALQSDEVSCSQKQQFCRPLRRPKFGFFRCTTKAQPTGYTIGSRCRLRCRKGYKPLAGSGVRKLCQADSTWTGGHGTCAPATCPSLPVPDNGHVSPASCSRNGSSVNTRCSLGCKEGFSLAGSEAATCGLDTKWKYSDFSPPSCEAVQYPPSFIICPPDMVKPLPPGSSSVYVMFSQPKTNVDWFRYVSAEPKWAKQLEGEVKLGHHSITFTAASPVGDKSANCTMNIHIKDTEPPRVISCPHSFEESLSRGQMLKKISWSEPVFRDNVGVHQMTASFLPGHYFPEGKHHVLYQAADAEGNRARCGFTITVKRERLFPPAPSQPRYNQTTSHKPPSSVLQLPPPHLPPPNLSPRNHPQPKSPYPHCNQVPDVPNGRMVCLSQNDRLKCTPVCEDGHVFYQKFSSRPPTYICSEHRIDWKITKFIPDCSPVEQPSQIGTCPPGWEARDDTCVACPPGMFRDSAPLCQLCGKGRYAEGFGSSTCSTCPGGQYTLSLGVRSRKKCKGTSSGNRYSAWSKHKLSSINRGYNPSSMTSLQERYNHKNTKPSPPRYQPIPATPSTTPRSISRSSGGYGGLTHYNSWLVEQPRQNKNRRYRRRHRRH